MSHKILRQLSKELELIIPTEELRKEIGLKAIVDLAAFENYLKAFEKEDLLYELTQKSEGFFVLNDDEFLNDHLLVGFKSPLIPNENNSLIFLLPSVLEYETETHKSIEDICALFTNPSEIADFKEQIEICIVKCKIVAHMRTENIKKQNLN